MLIPSDLILEAPAVWRAAKLTKLEFQYQESDTVWLFSGTAVKISIIIVHFYGEAHLIKCLRSIPQHPSISELIVFDNGSEEGFLERINSIRKDVIVISNTKNIGYGAAVNKAEQCTSGEFLLILNQDVVFHNDTLTELLLSVERNKNISIWGAQLQDINGAEQGSAGPFPTIFNWLTRLFKPKPERKYYGIHPKAGSKVDWVTGAFLAIRRSSLITLNGFNEGYFMYYEDVDLCHRAKSLGHLTGISSATATHSSPISERDAVRPDLSKAIRQGQLRYFNEHRPKWEFLMLLTIIRVYYYLKGWEWQPTYFY